MFIYAPDQKNHPFLKRQKGCTKIHKTYTMVARRLQKKDKG